MNLQQILIRTKVQDGCIIWTGARDPRGYGNVRIDGIKRLIHRYIYERFNGALVQGLTIDHLCMQKSCINPEHLEQVTQRINNDRGNVLSSLNAVKTHCKRGHPFDVENTYHYRNQRHCKICVRATSRRYYERLAIQRGKR